MPAQLPLLICILLICYLFWMDRKNSEGVSKAIWIPLLLMLPSSSRELSFWIYYFFGIGSFSASNVEGNPIDRAIQGGFIILGVIVLSRRNVNWSEVFGQNKWMWVYFGFGAISLFWSDYPFVSFKRLIKALGNVIIALIVLTEQRPYEALGAILRRLAFALLPLSVLFIKYYPALGRAYTDYMGTPLYRGVAGGKNGLGLLCVLSGIYFLWNLLHGYKKGDEAGRKPQWYLYLIMLSMITWLLHMANSATSLICMGVAFFIFAASRNSVMARETSRLVWFAIACAATYGAVDWAFGVKETIISILGRRPDLTNRIPLWEALLGLVKNPVLGTGYEAFWLGDRATFMHDVWGLEKQAHNGYLEIYLNLGALGVAILICWILSGLLNIARLPVAEYAPATLRLCLIVVICLYNWTEATFIGVSHVWSLFIISTMNVPREKRKR